MSDRGSSESLKGGVAKGDEEEESLEESDAKTGAGGGLSMKQKSSSSSWTSGSGDLMRISRKALSIAASRTEGSSSLKESEVGKEACPFSSLTFTISIFKVVLGVVWKERCDEVVDVKLC